MFPDGTVRIIGTEKYFVAHAKVKQGCLHGHVVVFGWKPIFDTKQDTNSHYLFPNRYLSTHNAN